MTTTFDQWEKDPFFSAAEEVQDSADRMRAIYRNWIHEEKERSPDSNPNGELRRDLRTALGTAKWQLEEFDRAARMSEDGRSVEGDARARRAHFVSAIGSEIVSVENSLGESKVEEGGSGLSWGRLDEGERDELASFLSGPSFVENCGKSAMDVRREDVAGYSKRKPPRPVELPKWGHKEERMCAHRRTVSAGDELGSWAIGISSEDHSRGCNDVQPRSSLPKVLSLSGLSGEVQSTSKVNWGRNGICKWRMSDRQHSSETMPLQNHQDRQESRSWYGRSKSCVSCISNGSYWKQLRDWIRALQRKLLRSQYQIQYSRPIQVVFWVVTAVLLIVLFILSAT